MKKVGIQYLVTAGLFLLIGQIFADEPYRALIFELNDEGDNYFQEKEILKKVINTVSILR
jgi:hypothetical protein